MASEDKAPTTGGKDDKEAVTEEPEATEFQEKPRQAKPDEVYCTSCGSPIKKEADICPECGVRQEQKDESQTVDTTGESSLSDRRQYELEKIASKDITTTVLWGIFVTPVAYLKVGKTGLALLNLCTLNYILLGWIIVPFHTRKMIKDAREELRKAGVAGY